MALMTGVVAFSPVKVMRSTGLLPAPGRGDSRSRRLSGIPRLMTGSTKLRVVGCLGWAKMSKTGPCSITRPPSITATLWQISLMTAISWVISTMVRPSRRLMSPSRCRICVVVSGSSAEVASSDSSTFGLLASARAMPTRCFCPPDSSAG